MEGEREKLLRLDEVLHERVIGQDEAVQLVADAVIRARAGIKDPRRPIGSFIFLGPTGVGKTELSRALAEALFDSEDNIVRLDMSEYQERHTVSRLMGAPPGYVGYEEGGQLTEAVRRKPYSVVLFDEIEKAHPDVFNTLLQILDDGRLTDAQGRTVDFRNTVIIMTSNIGSLYLLEGIDDDGEIPEDVRGTRDGRAARALPPRVPQPRRRDRAVQAADARGDRADRRPADRRTCASASPTGASTLELTEPARELIAREGYDPVYGARPLRRFIQREVETRIGRALLSGEIRDGATITLDAEGDELVVAGGTPARRRPRPPEVAEAVAIGADPAEVRASRDRVRRLTAIGARAVGMLQVGADRDARLSATRRSRELATELGGSLSERYPDVCWEVPPVRDPLVTPPVRAHRPGRCRP